MLCLLGLQSLLGLWCLAFAKAVGLAPDRAKGSCPCYACVVCPLLGLSRQAPDGAMGSGPYWGCKVP